MITVKTNILNQTKDARSVIVIHTRKDLFGTNDADEYHNIYIIFQHLFSFIRYANFFSLESIFSICTYIIYVSWKGYQKGTGKD